MLGASMFMIKNEKGQALILVLLFSLVGTLFVAMVLYMVLRGTEMSGIQKRFQTALDAAYVGVTTETQFLEAGPGYTLSSPRRDESGNPSDQLFLFRGETGQELRELDHLQRK
jgi:hypothetical protein